MSAGGTTESILNTIFTEVIRGLWIGKNLNVSKTILKVTALPDPKKPTRLCIVFDALSVGGIIAIS